MYHVCIVEVVHACNSEAAWNALYPPSVSLFCAALQRLAFLLVDVPWPLQRTVEVHFSSYCTFAIRHLVDVITSG